ncbi:unnamed protein product, partial [Prorocentrum cordatum]
EVMAWTANTHRWSLATRVPEEAQPEHALAQEHRGKANLAPRRASTWARRLARKTAMGRAESTGAGALGTSGGTAVPMTKARGSKQAGTLQHCSHRCVAAEVGLGLGLQVKVPLASVCLEHGVGLEGNAQLLEGIGGQVRGQRRPWILGSDWNMDPCLPQEWAHRNCGEAYPNVVDDVLAQAAGRAQHVRKQFPQAMQRLVDLLEAKDLAAAWHKTRFVAGGEETARISMLAFADSGTALERAAGARNTGCDTNDGRLRRTGEQDARTDGDRDLGGAGVTGAANRELQQLRIQAAKAEGRAVWRRAGAPCGLRASRWGGQRDPGASVAAEGAGARATRAAEPTRALPRGATEGRWKEAERLLSRRRPRAGAVSPAVAPRLSTVRRRSIHVDPGEAAWLLDRGLASKDSCERSRRQREMLWHRHFGRDAARASRRGVRPELVRSAARRALEQGEEDGERFARGVFPEVTPAWMAPHERPDLEEVNWVKRPRNGYLQGRVFVDGSASDPAEQILRRAGWAIVQYGEMGLVLGAVRCTVPLAWEPLQLTRDGEDYAFHFLSNCSAAPLEAFSDCAGPTRQATDIRRGASDRRGVEAPLHEARRSELGGRGEVRATKVEAHRSRAKCATETERQAVGLVAGATARRGGVPNEAAIELEERPANLSQAEGEEAGGEELQPIIRWMGHHLGEFTSEQGERGPACQRCEASGAQGHLKVKKRRRELRFQECRGEGKGCKEQLGRQRKGLHPLPSKSLGGVSEALWQELEEAAGGMIEGQEEEPD